MGTSSIVIGGVRVVVPEQCLGPTLLTTCPELVEHIQQADQAKSPSLKEAIGINAKELGQRAIAQVCRGCDFKDSDSGFTWRNRCSLTGRVETS